MEICKKIKSLFIYHEKWLPIINEAGTVFGKIAYSQSISEKDEWLHPIIRIAFIHNGMLFLTKKKDIETNNKPCLDYPFERYILYKETIEEAVEKTIKSAALAHNCNYLFHYIHHSEKIHRLVYFYVCHIHNNDLLGKINISKGRWWTPKQIKENLSTSLFSAFFKNEFEFLDSTVLTVG